MHGRGGKCQRQRDIRAKDGRGCIHGRDVDEDALADLELVECPLIVSQATIISNG